MGGWFAAVAGILLYHGTQGFKMYSEVCDLVQLRKDPTLKQMYDHYYQSAVKRADIDVKSSTGSRDSYRLAEVTAPNSMDEEDIDALKKATKKRGLSTKVQNGGKLELNGWVEAFMSILKSYSDDPEMLVTTMDELIWNYCWAFWNLSDNDLEAYISDLVTDRSNAEIEKLVQKVRKASGTERIEITKEFSDSVKRATAPLLTKAVQTLQRQSCEEIQREVVKQMLPLLNTRLVFRVKDSTLAAGQSFSKSVYCKDWKAIKQNSRFVAGGEGIRYDDKELITPMRFGGDPMPLFYPLIPRDLKDPTKPSYNGPKMNYPYTDDFLPRAGKNSDIIYKCTYYHYLMMGSPRQMLFTAFDKPEDYKTAKPIAVDIKIPPLSGNKSVDVILEVKPAEPVWELQHLVYESHYSWVKPKMPSGLSGAEQAEWLKQYQFRYDREEQTITADANKYSYVSRAEGYGLGTTRRSWDKPQTANYNLPGAVVTTADIQRVLTSLEWKIKPSDDPVLNNKQMIPAPDENGKRTLYIKLYKVVLVYRETSRQKASANAWTHIDRDYSDYWSEQVK